MTGHIVDIFVWLLLAVAVLALLARRFHVPYPIFFVIGGLLIGLIPELPRIRLDPELVFLLFLPPLLFPAALFTSWRDFRANLRSISLLAVGFVLFTMTAVAWLAFYFFHLPLAVGFVLGAIISPPDAIAATAIAERLSVPRRIVTVLEGESLFNDATALVAYRFAVAAVATGSFSIASAGVEFLVVGAGGILVGLSLGWLATHFRPRMGNPPIQITFSLLMPFAAYLLAERLQVSGVLAVVSAGLYIGRRGPEILSAQTRLQAIPVWEMVQFLLNGFVFILIGLQLPEVMQTLSVHHDYSIGELVWYALIISLAVIVIRILWVFPASYLPRLLFKSIRKRDPYPSWRHVTVVAWTGMRGVVSLAAALALPVKNPFPDRHLILFLTFIVILVTLVVQGLSLPFLIRWLGIKDDGAAAREEREARLKANQAAVARLKEISENNPAKEDAKRRLIIEYEDRVRQLEDTDPATANTPRHLFSSEYELLSQETLIAERKTILQLRNRGVISDEVLRRIQRDIDLAEARLRRESAEDTKP